MAIPGLPACAGLSAPPTRALSEPGFQETTAHVLNEPVQSPNTNNSLLPPPQLLMQSDLTWLRCTLFWMTSPSQLKSEDGECVGAVYLGFLRWRLLSGGSGLLFEKGRFFLPYFFFFVAVFWVKRKELNWRVFMRVASGVQVFPNYPHPPALSLGMESSLPIWG